MQLLNGLRMRRPVAPSVEYTDADDVDFVDFSNAVLYITALQSITSVVTASVVTVAACTLLPSTAVSSVRTVVLASICGALIVKKPVQLGRVHGLLLVFRALQPCVGFYLVALVGEQLVHSCARDVEVPSWRRLVFNLTTLLMMVSGFMRARRPLSSTDLPFLLTVVALLIAALLPPPAIVMTGPLCAAPTLQIAAERVARAFVFALLYAVFVFAAAPPAQSSGEVFVCVARAFAATTWILACHVYLIPLALVQGGVVIFVRVFSNEYALDGAAEPYSPVPQRDVDSDVEAPVVGAGVAPSFAATPAIAPVAPIAPENEDSQLITPAFQPLGPRGLVDIGGGSGAGMSQAQLAAIAARIED